MASKAPVRRLPAPPAGLLVNASLFIDFDGTLVDLVERPDAVAVDPPLHALLDRLSVAFSGRLAIVSGRSIAQLEGFLGPLADRLALAGSHGVERRLAGGPIEVPEIPEGMAAAHEVMAAFARANPGAIVEHKSFGVALHYRLAPALEPAAHRLAEAVANRHGLAIQHGKMMVELKVGSGDKGAAIEAFMAAPPMAGSRPVFLGDDLTDEPGFVAVKRLRGAGILVGDLRESSARYRLNDVAGVRAWLAAALKAPA